MKEFTFSWQNVIEGGGVALAITGMIVVFCGLLLISVFIANIPRIFSCLDKAAHAVKNRGKERSAAAEEAPVSSQDETELLAVLGFVMELELERGVSQGQQVITFGRSGRKSIWAEAGKMRSLSARR